MTSSARTQAEPLSVLEIHLDRLCRNYLALRKMLARGTDCAAVVKADAYGLGALAVVPELHGAGCRHFYVAHASEGLAARAALNSLSRSAGEGWGEGEEPTAGAAPSPSHAGAWVPPSPAGRERGNSAQIYVLHGPHGTEPEELVRKELTPVLNTPEDVETWASFAKKTGKKLPAILHIDTGMNRLGLSAADVGRLADNIDILNPLDVRYVMSHLACSDTPEHPKNQEQLEAFRRLSSRLGRASRLSFANSGGIFLGKDYHFDQVRPGCAIYGMNPQNAPTNPMLGTITLKARILQTRDAAAGETVGYGATYRVPKNAKLATISLGYADGYLRSLTGQGIVHVAGHECPVVGRVSMDAIVADVTAADGAAAGDWAEIIGPRQSVDEVAARAGTIGYEILTSLGKRYARVYTGRERA